MMEGYSNSVRSRSGGHSKEVKASAHSGAKDPFTGPGTSSYTVDATLNSHCFGTIVTQCSGTDIGGATPA